MTFATLTDAQADRLLDLALDGESIERIVNIAALELGVDADTAARVVQEMHDHPIAKIVLAHGRRPAPGESIPVTAEQDAETREYVGARLIADHNAARRELWDRYPEGEGEPS